VAGESWSRNKGLTSDASSPQNYFEILETLPWDERLRTETIERARKYAYHFFFRRMVPLPFMEPTKQAVPYRLAISSLEELLPGRHPGLDLVCAGILSGTPFVYEAERLGVHDG